MKILKTLTLLITLIHLHLFSQNNVLAISQSIINHFIFVSDEELLKITDQKGGWAPIDYATFEEIIGAKRQCCTITPSGSGVNLIKGLAALGNQCTVVTKIGEGPYGKFYIKSLNDLGITTQSQTDRIPTGHCLCFITPDGERTFRTFIGAAANLSDLELSPTLFEGIDLFHIEGYLLVDENYTLKIAQLAKQAGVKISFDLANVRLIDQHREFLLDFLPNYVDVLFSNEIESRALTGLDAHNACEFLGSFCETAVVTMSEKGSYAKSGDKMIHTPAQNVRVLDTTGAGDFFAAGFLHEYLKKSPLQDCAILGTQLASYIIQIVGDDISGKGSKDFQSTIVRNGN